MIEIRIYQQLYHFHIFLMLVEIVDSGFCFVVIKRAQNGKVVRVVGGAL